MPSCQDQLWPLNTLRYPHAGFAPLAGAFFIPSQASCAPYTKTDTIATIKLTKSYHYASQEKEASKEKASDRQRLRQEFTR